MKEITEMSLEELKQEQIKVDKKTKEVEQKMKRIKIIQGVQAEVMEFTDGEISLLKTILDYEQLRRFS